MRHQTGWSIIICVAFLVFLRIRGRQYHPGIDAGLHFVAVLAVASTSWLLFAISFVSSYSITTSGERSGVSENTLQTQVRALKASEIFGGVLLILIG